MNTEIRIKLFCEFFLKVRGSEKSIDDYLRELFRLGFYWIGGGRNTTEDNNHKWAYVPVPLALYGLIVKDKGVGWTLGSSEQIYLSYEDLLSCNDTQELNKLLKKKASTKKTKGDIFKEYLAETYVSKKKKVVGLEVIVDVIRLNEVIEIMDEENIIFHSKEYAERALDSIKYEYGDSKYVYVLYRNMDEEIILIERRFSWIFKKSMKEFFTNSKKFEWKDRFSQENLDHTKLFLCYKYICPVK